VFQVRPIFRNRRLDISRLMQFDRVPQLGLVGGKRLRDEPAN
jgi:hypothetical protein